MLSPSTCMRPTRRCTAYSWDPANVPAHTPPSGEGRIVWCCDAFVVARGPFPLPAATEGRRCDADCRRRSPPADTEPGDSLSAPRCVPGGAESELDICYHLGLYQRFFFPNNFTSPENKLLDTMTLCGHFVPVRRNRDHLGRQRQDKEEGSKGGRYYYIVSHISLYCIKYNCSRYGTSYHVRGLSYVRT